MLKKNPVLRIFAILIASAILGPIVANIVSPTVAGQYNQALLGLLAALLYKGPVYALVISLVVVVVARWVLGLSNLELFRQQLDEPNNDSYATILGFTALIVTIVLIVVLGG